MAINDNGTRAQYSASASQTVFAYPFEVFKEADITVEQNGVVISAYTLSGVGTDSGGNVTLTTGATSGDVITIYRDMDLDRDTDYQANGDFLAAEVNNDMDRLWAGMQQIESDSKNAIRASLNDTVLTSSNTELANVATRAGKNLGFDSTGLLEYKSLSIVSGDTNFTTKSVMENDTGAIVGTSIYILSDRADGIFDTVTKGTTPNVDLENGFNIIISAVDATKVFVLRVDEVLTSTQMGAVGDGVSNDTGALKAFIQYCIDNTNKGYIDAGTYLIDLGVLAFDNNHITTPFPIIETAGKEAVIFINSSDIDSPYLSFTNGTAISGAGKYWEGGFLGGISFSRTTGSAANTNQHGLLLRGFFFTEFGIMKAESIGGDGIHIEQQLYLGFNPDPYHIANCVFGGIEANFGDGYAFYNDNYVGLSGCVIRSIRAILQGGVFFGMGAANRIDSISAGSNAGYLIGDDVAATGGASSRFSIGSYEADDMQYGINANRVIDSNFGIGRFVHRYNFQSKNPGEGYWPRVAIEMGSNSSSNLTYSVIHRVEAGGTKPELGVFTEFNSTSNSAFVNLYYKILDNAAFGFVDTDLYQNFTTNNTVKFSRDEGLTMIDTIGDNASLARAPTTYSIPNGGFGTNIVEFSTTLKDPAGNYNPATYQYTVREAGLHDIRCQLNLSLTAGNRIRIGIRKNAAVTSGSSQYCTVTGVGSYFYDYRADFAVGDTIEITADNNSGGAVALSTIIGANDNYLSVNRYK